jgi:hypothetical protein
MNGEPANRDLPTAGLFGSSLISSWVIGPGPP